MTQRSPIEQGIELTDKAINTIDPIGIVALSIGAVVALVVVYFAIYVISQFRRMLKKTNGHVALEVRLEKEVGVVHTRVNRAHEKIDKAHDKIDRVVDVQSKMASDISYIRGLLEKRN